MTVWTENPSDKNTVLTAPLYFDQGDTSDELNANYSISYLIANGVPSHKLVLPVISGGYSFHLISVSENGLNARAKDRIYAQFHTVCDNIKKDNWTVVHDTSRVGSYTYLDDKWTSYDDVEDVNRKAEYILQMNLGGGAILSLNGDDFENKCNCGKSPLLKAMNQLLRNVQCQKNNNCT